MRRKRFPVMLSAKERLALQVLAQEDGLSASAIIRILIRQSARKRGLWPTPPTADQHTPVQHSWEAGQ